MSLRFACVLALTGLMASPVVAQRASREAGGPNVGDALPEVSGYAVDGTEFKFSSLKGKHAVIVFGCLT